MFKQENFWDGVLWLFITGIATYAGLYRMTGHYVFVYGAWAGIAFANAVIRFNKAFKKNKEQKE